MIGHNADQANHQYDLTDFWNSVKAGNMPSVSFLKAPTYQDGHPEISDPLEEVNGLCGHPLSTAYQDRCGYGPSIPLLVISPYAKVNFVDHQITDQTSILRLIEDNWHLGRVGDQSFDSKSGSLMKMFNFGSNRHLTGKIFLNSNDGMLNSTTR